MYHKGRLLGVSKVANENTVSKTTGEKAMSNENMNKRILNTSLFEKHSGVIRNLSASAFNEGSVLNDSLLLERDGPLSVYYAPFEYTNPEARVVVVGITPGKTQMINALKEAQRQLIAGADSNTSLRAAKKTGAFSGAMRPNLISLLDFIGLNKWLKINSCSDLFGAASNLAQTSSILRYPVFLDGKNYNGTPNVLKHPLLRKYLLNFFGADARGMSNAVFVPLGDKVAEALQFLVNEGFIKADRVLAGLPHPSGANAERIAYFLGAKAKGALSSKTDPAKIDKAKVKLLAKMTTLCSAN